MDVFLGILMALVFCFIYFIPSFIAYSRGHKNALAIFILNLFLGYTFVGWVGALIWSVYNSEMPVVRNKRK